MQYFTKELWRDMNDEREWIRERAAKEWAANSRRYYAKFETIKKRLPEKFVAELLARDGFHDYDFLEINFVSKENIISKKVTYSCELKLTDGKVTATKATIQVDYDKALKYGTHVELGARGRPANPFLRKAVDDNQDKINEAIVKEISKALGV